MLLSIENLHVTFPNRSGSIRAVRGVSFHVQKGECVGIVGESGSGKTVTCLTVPRLIWKDTAQIQGTIHFDGHDISSLSNEQIRSIRGSQVSMIFQDPSSSLNPYMRIGDQLIEPLQIHKKMKRADALSIAETMLTRVGLSDVKKRMRCYPREFSGGMRQRVMIAMALITNPQLVLADEPTTALDVTIQEQILRLLSNLQREQKMSMIFITHNLGVVARICDRVLVMYGGKIMESAPTADLLSRSAHPYTHALIKSLPSMHSPGETLSVIQGSPPDPSVEIHGCPFAPRCQYSNEQCCQDEITLQQINGSHATACSRILKGETLW